MFTFRQKLIISYLSLFIVFNILIFAFVKIWVNSIVFHAIESRSSKIIDKIKEAPNNEALVKRLKDLKGLMFFRSSIITDEKKVLYDSHTKRLLGPKFSQEYVVDHPEVLQAFEKGTGYHEDYSQILHQKFSYIGKSFDFHGRTYVLRTAFPYQYLSEMTHDFEIAFLEFSTIILLMFSLVTWFAIQHLTSPIQRIITAIKPYQEGLQNILPAIEIKRMSSKDDFGKLALTLNSLSSKIQNHIDTITQERNEKEAILESLGEGVIAVDVNLQVIYNNTIATKLFNSPINSFVGVNFSDYKQTKCEELLLRCQEEKTPLTEMIEICRDGKKIFLDVVAAPKKDSSGAILVLQDKSDRYKLLEMWRDFVANASHELKTPITIMRGFAETLHDNPNLTAELQHSITSKIMVNCNRMTALIKDLLTLADVENIPSHRLGECNINELAIRCCKILAGVFQDANIKINGLASSATQENITIIADHNLLELAIMNLIENAIKYSSAPAHVEVKTSQLADEVVIAISDKGMGISEADQENVFDRFYTVDKARSKKMGGSGLGLSIVKTIVEKHFGSIVLESKIGVGSTFTIRLPKSIHNILKNKIDH